VCDVRVDVRLHPVNIIPAVQPSARPASHARDATGVVPRWLVRPFALGGFVFFSYALLYFAYRYTSAFARDVTGAIDARRIVIDVTLFSAFAFHHSLFARDIIRKRITGIVGALERSVYVWIASALFIAVCAWWQPIAGSMWRIDQPVAVFALRAAQLAGVWLTLRSAFMIDVMELAGVRQVANAASGDADAPGAARPTVFKTSGPYGIVRHPIYSGWFLLVFAVPHMTMTRFVFAVTSSLYLVLAIPLEERSLRRSSAGAYDRYIREVRWKLLPHVW
jgi:hypothetical protein